MYLKKVEQFPYQSPHHFIHMKTKSYSKVS